MNHRLAAVVVLSSSLFVIAHVEGSQKARGHSRAVESKFAEIERNGALVHPNPAPTELTESEVNAYLASGAVEMPAGVESVRLQGHPGSIVGVARVDFDKVRAGTKNASPLLSLFTGVHDVVVSAQAKGTVGQGIVRVQSVWFDGTEIPKFMVQLFVEKYLAPRYPGIGMTSKFPLPHKIDTAVVGQHIVTVVQK